MSVSRWSVWLAGLDPVVGSEQGRTRPVHVVSETALNDVLPVVNVLPVTSRKGNRRIYPNEALLPAGAAGLTAESILLCYQIRTLDKRRLLKLFGTLDAAALRDEVLEALRFQLGLNP
jgi:mRNA interferase MazF